MLLVKQAAASAFNMKSSPEFTLSTEWKDIGIQEIDTALVHDGRSDLSVADVVAAIEDGRFPLLLTGRTDHLEFLFEKLVARNPAAIRRAPAPASCRQTNSSSL